MEFCLSQQKIYFRIFNYVEYFFEHNFDYFIKSSGKSNFLKNTLMALPIYNKIDNYLSQELIARVVALNAINSSYSIFLELLYKN